VEFSRWNAPSAEPLTQIDQTFSIRKTCYAVSIWVERLAGLSLRRPSQAFTLLDIDSLSLAQGEAVSFASLSLSTAICCKETSVPVNCPTGCTLFTEEYIPLYVGFAITPSTEQILHGEGATFDVSPVSSPTPCATTVWHPAVPVTLTITSGSELGEFVDQDGQSLGQSVTRKGSQIGTIRFAANGEQPQGAQGTVTIDASSRDITKTISIIVLSTTPIVDHFEVRLEPEEIGFTETSKIFVQARDANDQDIEFDDSEKLLFYLTNQS
jgi:hypothetical protein